MAEVRLVDFDGTQIGIVSTRDALDRASKQELDLVEVSASAKPPVCRIMDYGKFKYEQGKKEKNAKKGQTRVKEIKFHANVADHDYDTKVRHAIDFLEQGHRVKCSLYFRGRENDHREFGYDILNRVIKDCEDHATPEQSPRMMGRSLIMLLTPSKTKGKGKNKEKNSEGKKSGNDAS